MAFKTRSKPEVFSVTRRRNNSPALHNMFEGITEIFVMSVVANNRTCHILDLDKMMMRLVNIMLDN